LHHITWRSQVYGPGYRRVHREDEHTKSLKAKYTDGQLAVQGDKNMDIHIPFLKSSPEKEILKSEQRIVAKKKRQLKAG
jgi:hypothetical protein